jgi:hypothetical protein
LGIDQERFAHSPKRKTLTKVQIQRVYRDAAKEREILRNDINSTVPQIPRNICSNSKRVKDHDKPAYKVISRMVSPTPELEDRIYPLLV